jgi:hypothetical protein
VFKYRIPFDANSQNVQPTVRRALIPTFAWFSAFYYYYSLFVKDRSGSVIICNYPDFCSK